MLELLTINNRIIKTILFFVIIINKITNNYKKLTSVLPVRLSLFRELKAFIEFNFLAIPD